jgi:hypothetical protein
MNLSNYLKDNYQVINNNNYTKINFYQAIELYKQGRTVECRILNSDGEIIEWEKYNQCEGLNIALEFNEILNGHWFLITHKN